MFREAHVTPACAYGQYCGDPLFTVQFGLQYFQSNNSGRLSPGSLSRVQ